MKEREVDLKINKLMQAENKARGLIPIEPWDIPFNLQQKKRISKSPNNMQRYQAVNSLKREYFQHGDIGEEPQRNGYFNDIDNLAFLIELDEHKATQLRESERKVDIVMQIADILRKNPHGILERFVDREVGISKFNMQSLKGGKNERQHDEDLQSDPLYPLVEVALGRERLLAVMEIGQQECVDRHNVHSRIYDVIAANSIGNSQLSFNLAKVFQRPSAENPENIRKTVHAELAIHSVDPITLTLRRALEINQLVVVDNRSQAMSHRERGELGVDGRVTYLRGQTYLENTFINYAEQLKGYYSLSDRDDVMVHLTGTGLLGPKLALLGILGHKYSSSLQNLYVDSPYFEINKFIAKMRKMSGVILEHNSRIDPDNIDQIKAAIENAGKCNQPLAVIAEPIGSYPSMKVVDIQAILEIATRNFRQEAPFFLVSDLTTLGGVPDLIRNAQQYVQQGSNVNIVASHSLLKFFEWGLDVAQGGAVLGFGPEFKAGSALRKSYIKFYNMFNMDPDIAMVGALPPIDEEYLRFRANIMGRNSRLISCVLSQYFPDLPINYPGLRAEDVDNLAFAGFQGAYLFIKLPNQAIVEKVIQSIENQQEESLGYIESGTSFGHDFPRVEAFGSYIRFVPGTLDLCASHFVAFNLVKILGRSL